MLLSETLTCRIPSENAVKLEKLYCTTDPANYPPGLGDLATWVGVIITATMAYFAFRAWKISQSQLRITRDIAINEQRVPALIDFLESTERLLGSDPEATDERQLQQSLKTVLRNHDRWTLTYPVIYRDGHLRDTLMNIYDLTCLYNAFRRLNPNLMLDTKDEVEEFFNARDQSRLSLNKHLGTLRDTCLDLHNNENGANEMNNVFKKLSLTTKNDYENCNKAYPLWRLVAFKSG